jgi:hypothetical protein
VIESRTTRSFRLAFSSLPEEIQRQARRAYRLFQASRSHMLPGWPSYGSGPKDAALGLVFRVKFDSFPGILSSLLDCPAVGNATRKEWHENSVSALLFRYEGDLIRKAPFICGWFYFIRHGRDRQQFRHTESRHRRISIKPASLTTACPFFPHRRVGEHFHVNRAHYRTRLKTHLSSIHGPIPIAERNARGSVIGEVVQPSEQ